MADERNRDSTSVRRRDFLHLTVIGGGALVAVSLAASGASAEQKKKFSQQQAHYQPTPKSGQRCQNCALWQAPTACQVVEGQVSPAGWCILYQAKA
ncbi:MAG TPA: high-potential iron-sulfur protein [Sphingomicrobium sp.]|jgi:anaerobic selenocysteine-containing dehydrogenase|nr:high-potential iron-sulfur protein [Sphingomicrobium sp.]